jgi:hypothetical protein
MGGLLVLLGWAWRQCQPMPIELYRNRYIHIVLPAMAWQARWFLALLRWKARHQDSWLRYL